MGVSIRPGATGIDPYALDGDAHTFGCESWWAARQSPGERLPADPGSVVAVVPPSVTRR